MIHTIKGFNVVNEADVFPEFPCFSYNPMDVGNSMSGSSTFLNPTCTSASFWFTYYWGLAWRILCITFVVVRLFRHVWLFKTSWTIVLRLPRPSLSSRVCWDPCPWSWWCHTTMSSSVIPFSSCLQPFQYQGLFQWVSSSHQFPKVLEFQLQHQSFQWIFRADFL